LENGLQFDVNCPAKWFLKKSTVEMCILGGFLCILSIKFHKKNGGGNRGEKPEKKRTKRPGKSPEKICKFDESVFLIGGVYREEYRAYNRA